MYCNICKKTDEQATEWVKISQMRIATYSSVSGSMGDIPPFRDETILLTMHLGCFEATSGYATKSTKPSKEDLYRQEYMGEFVTDECNECMGTGLSSISPAAIVKCRRCKGSGLKGAAK